MRHLREYVQAYVLQLSGPAADNAWHLLVEAGPAALPHVVEAFNATSDPAVKIALLQIVCEYRSADAIPFFDALLRNGHSEIWKAALDGLVTIGGRATLDVLARAREPATAERRKWIDESVGQISQAETPS